MRTIKFRGKVDGHWLHASPEDDIGNCDWEQFWYIIDRETVGEYIGGKDAKGNEIYEGDILGVDDPEDKSRAIVVFHNSAFKAQIGSWLYDDVFSLWTVIGNIHDNPGLLKGK